MQEILLRKRWWYIDTEVEMLYDQYSELYTM